MGAQAYTGKTPEQVAEAQMEEKKIQQKAEAARAATKQKEEEEAIKQEETDMAAAEGKQKEKEKQAAAKEDEQKKTKKERSDKDDAAELTKKRDEKRKAKAKENGMKAVQRAAETAFKAKIKQEQANRKKVEAEKELHDKNVLAENEKKKAGPLIEVQQKSQKKLADVTNLENSIPKKVMLKRQERGKVDVTLKNLESDVFKEVKSLAPSIPVVRPAVNGTKREPASTPAASAANATNATKPEAPVGQDFWDKFHDEKDKKVAARKELAEKADKKYMKKELAAEKKMQTDAKAQAAKARTVEAGKEHDKLAKRLVNFASKANELKEKLNAPNVAPGEKSRLEAKLNSATAKAQAAEIQEVTQRANIKTMTKRQRHTESKVMKLEAKLEAGAADFAAAAGQLELAKDVTIAEKKAAEKKAAAATPKPKPPAPKQKTEAKPAAKPEAKPAAKPEAKPAAKPEAKKPAAKVAAEDHLGRLEPVPKGFVPNYECENHGKWSNDCEPLADQCMTSIVVRMKCRKTCGSCQQNFPVKEPSDDEMLKQRLLERSMYALDSAAELGQALGDDKVDTFLCHLTK